MKASPTRPITCSCARADTIECDDLRLLQQWVLANNRDLGMTFEIVPVVPSKETREVVAPFLDEK
jgi:uncharacterized protein DUF3303